MAHDPKSSEQSDQPAQPVEKQAAPHAVPADEMDFLDDAIPIGELTEAAPDSFGFDFRGAEPASKPTSAQPAHALSSSPVDPPPQQPARAEPVYRRQPVASGAGAVRCKTFIAKLRPEALERLDEQINAWLDANPGFDVKFATSSVGELIGKVREAALFVTVFV